MLLVRLNFFLEKKSFVRSCASWLCKAEFRDFWKGVLGSILRRSWSRFLEPQFVTLPKRLMKDRERRPDGVNGSQYKISSKWQLSQNHPPKHQDSQQRCSWVSGWMFSVRIEEHSGALTTSEKQAQHKNTPKLENRSLNFSHNEAGVRLEIL